MNVGLSNLDTLKKHLLAGTVKTDTRFDKIITDLGKGVAGQMEKFCNRKFARVVNDTFICTADRDHAYAPRYPLEDASKIELKADSRTGWEDQGDLILNWNAASGMVYWGAGIAYSWAQMRITFTGGFWFETLEPDDPAYPSQPPADATALPDDLKWAWLLQCRHVWAAIDKLGESLIDKEQKLNARLVEPLAPTVEKTLYGYVRYSMT